MGAEDRSQPDRGRTGDPPTVTAEDIAALRAQPGFAAARDAALAALLALYDRDRLLLRLLNDRGRLILVSAALFLHLGADPDDPTSGLTVGRMKAIFVQTGLGSATRAGAMIALMRWAGYLASAPTPADRRLQRMTVTPKLIEAHNRLWRGQFEVLAGLDPELAAAAPALLEHRQALAAFVAAATRRYLAGYRLADWAPELAAALDRNCGLAILAALVLEKGGGLSV